MKFTERIRHAFGNHKGSFTHQIFLTEKNYQQRYHVTVTVCEDCGRSIGGMQIAKNSSYGQTEVTTLFSGNIESTVTFEGDPDDPRFRKGEKISFVDFTNDPLEMEIVESKPLPSGTGAELTLKGIKK